jgi:2-amino-4-hydroxy-6-hydroxymethyldihydropteridine diphosphokinase
MVVTAFVALGSNLDGPREHIRQAFSDLAALPRTRCRRHSALYRSAPVGPSGQPDYINAVAELQTELEPLVLLSALQGIEQTHGRVPGGERWGPRPLDLDILLYADQCIDLPGLQVPHPAMAERAFVLYPLYELTGDMEIPSWGWLCELLKNCPAEGLEFLEDA